MLRLRVFISSPGDVGSERAVAVAVCERLQLEYRGLVQFETYLWERNLLRATEIAQSQILDIEHSDLAVFILWSRLGTRLPKDRFSRPDGSQYESGTEYEFEHALEAFNHSQKPDIVFYLKTAPVAISVRERAVWQQQTSELQSVNTFVDKWFRNEDGSFRSAFYDFEKTARFEELFEHHLRDWVRQRLRKVNPSLPERTWTHSPFRGLQPFDFEHALIYCGRTHLVSDVIETLKQRAQANRGFLMIVGMSGVGKSSLIRAGVLPLLARPYVVENVATWRRAVFRPSDGQRGLWAAFATALTEQNALPDLGSMANIQDLVRSPMLVLAIKDALSRATAHMRLERAEASAGNAVRLVVFVDQFEEIFNESVSADDRNRLAEVLTAMVASGEVWVLITLRADLYARCSELPAEFRDLVVQGGVYTVGGPRPPEISQMIKLPATMAGLTFEKRGEPEESLDDVLRDAAIADRGVLPLLEFTLDELWKLSQGSGMLRFADYEKLGGLYGALRLRANEEFEKLPSNAQAVLPALLTSLVRADPKDDRLIVESRVPRALFNKLSGADAFIDAFVHARLLIADQDPDGTPVIGLAHEALLREWPPAAEWIARSRELLRLRAGIGVAAALWKTSGDSEERLLSGGLLRDALKLLEFNPFVLTQQERSFVEASRTESRRVFRQRSYIGIAAAIAILVAVLRPGFVLEQIQYDLALAKSYLVVRDAKASIPLSPAAAANLAGNIKWLSNKLRGQLDELAQNPNNTPWGASQVWVAFHGLEPSIESRGDELRAFMTAKRASECNCWKETAELPPHSVVTAWVLYVLALNNQAATEEEISGVLSRQDSGGWWSMFPAMPDERNASASGTAWIIFALHHQRAANLIGPSQKAAVDEAIARAILWLETRRVPGMARWQDYSDKTRAEKREDFFAVSAFIVSVLKTVTGSQDRDRLWLQGLPKQVPEVDKDEMARAEIVREKSTISLDEVRYYPYPWAVAATFDAFSSGSAWEKARAKVWLDRALERRLTEEDFHDKTWVMAETLINFRRASAILAAVRTQ